MFIRRYRPLVRTVRKAFSDKTDTPLETTNIQTLVIDRTTLTPHEYFITQNRNMEKPFTGSLWDYADVGHYNCKICETRVFEYVNKIRA